jgi:hypothetical protein
MRPALVLCVACCLGVGLWVPVARAQTYPGAGKYYSGAGINGATTCQVTSCSSLAACQAYEYRSGCGGNSTGSCVACNNTKTNNQYYSSTGGLTNNCGLANKTQCTAGFRNSDATDISAGTCTSCGALAAGRYYTTPTSPTDTLCLSAPRATCPSYQYDANYFDSTKSANCTNSPAPSNSGFYINNTAAPGNTTYFPKTTCPKGQQIAAGDWSSTTIAGACEVPSGNTPSGYYYVDNPPGVATQTAATALCNMSSVYGSCTSGQYVTGCTNLSPGTCTACTNGGNNLIYTGKGQWNNACPVAGCSMPTSPACAANQYAKGCGEPGVTTLTCQPCINAVADFTFYIDSVGARYSNISCATTACTPCPAGQFKQGCGNLLSGDCVGCTNT